MRRLHLPHLAVGRLPLGQASAHHARDVLRLRAGVVVELFDAAGRTAEGTLARVDAECVWVDVLSVSEARVDYGITIASAVPKGDRADWLVEKLSELGARRWVPLMTERSVVHPAGEGKTARWLRLATESARQCRRAGVMTIAPLTPLADALAACGPGDVFLSTRPGGVSLADAPVRAAGTCFIGPEGGWTESEEAAFLAAGLTAARLTSTILRIETAALAAAALIATRRAAADTGSSP